MACFIVPGSEAIVATIVKKMVDNKEKSLPVNATKKSKDKISWSKKLSWLTTMLWGGTILLALEHIWHGEIIFYPPFLTAMESPADTAEMLSEMGTVGVGMAVLVTAIWIVMVLVADKAPALRKTLSVEGA